MRSGTMIFAVAAVLLLAELIASGYAHRRPGSAGLELHDTDVPARVVVPATAGSVAFDEHRIPFGRRLAFRLETGEEVRCWQIAAWSWCDAPWVLAVAP